MSENKVSATLSGFFILRALAGWALSAAVALPIASLIVSKTELSASWIGYISSGLSFLCAFCSGFHAVKGEKSGIIYKALISAAVITVMLLTLGFLAEGSELKSSSVLSLVSFTFSGCLLGAVMSPGTEKAGAKNKLRLKK